MREELLNHPKGELVLTRAIFLVERETFNQEDAIRYALEEFYEDFKKPWGNFILAFGAAFFGTGLCLWLTALYLTNPPLTQGQCLPFIFLTIFGFILMIGSQSQD